MALRTSPFADDLLPEVPLARAPLVRVIAQVRFPELLAVEQREVIAPLQAALREPYPVLRPELTQVFRPGAVPPVQSSTAWRFIDSASEWRASLTPTFFALETTRYTSRSDFVARIGQLSDAIATHIGPSQIDRLGVRYIDRVIDPELRDLDRLLHPAVRGVVGAFESAHMVHAMSEAVFKADPALLRARWGYLPPWATHDEATLEPIDGPGWVLDLDVHRSGEASFSSEWIRAEASRLAERAYRFFRWAVTDEFLKRYGGRT